MLQQVVLIEGVSFTAAVSTAKQEASLVNTQQWSCLIYREHSSDENNTLKLPLDLKWSVWCKTIVHLQI